MKKFIFLLLLIFAIPKTFASSDDFAIREFLQKKLLLQNFEIEKTLPELLSDKKKRYIEELKLSDKQILFILSDNKYIELFEKTLEKITEPKLIANYIEKISLLKWIEMVY